MTLWYLFHLLFLFYLITAISFCHSQQLWAYGFCSFEKDSPACVSSSSSSSTGLLAGGKSSAQEHGEGSTLHKCLEVRFSGSTTETSTMTILRYRNSVLLTMGTSWPESSILPTDNKNTTWHMGTHGPSLLSSHADDRFGTIQCCVWGLENARLLKYTVCVPKVKLSSKCTGCVQIWNWTRLAFGRRPFFNDGAQKDASHLGECCPSLSQKLSCDLLFKSVVSWQWMTHKYHKLKDRVNLKWEISSSVDHL